MNTVEIVQDGRRVITVHADGKRQVVEFHDDAVARHAVIAMSLRLSDDGPIAFGPFIKRWDEHYATVRLTPSSYACYMSLVENHLLPRFNDTSIDEMTRSTVDLFIGDLRSQGMKGRTITPIITKLQAVMGVAKKWGYIDRNPVREIDAIFMDTDPLTK